MGRRDCVKAARTAPKMTAWQITTCQDQTPCASLTPMFELLDIASWPSGTVNEDRAGTHGHYAWVIDGATDVLEAPLTPGPTDAAWFAEHLDREIAAFAQTPDAPLREWPELLSNRLTQRFSAIATRAPIARHEHPSAAGIITRLSGHTLEYVGVGDCALIAETGDDLHLVGITDDKAGDAWVVEHLRAFRKTAPAAQQAKAREHLWPKLRAARARMNLDDGYGVFSIMPPPVNFVISGRVKLLPVRAFCSPVMASCGSAMCSAATRPGNCSKRPARAASPFCSKSCAHWKRAIPMASPIRVRKPRMMQQHFSCAPDKAISSAVGEALCPSHHAGLVISRRLSSMTDLPSAANPRVVIASENPVCDGVTRSRL
jgi:hypothetical protein